MPSFEMVVVGAGGGPDETNLSAYLLKPFDATWEDGILALEAGSGQGALSQILTRDPQLFGCDEDSTPLPHSASEIYSFVRSFFITHAHLDHVNSLIISAGSLGGPRKRIYAAKQTLHDLESIFSNRIWPNLASWNEEDDNHKFLYTVLRSETKYINIHPNVSVRSLPVSHGCNEEGPYESAVFFFRHDDSCQEFLFFGDVEPDSVATRPQTINVWRAAAPKIPEKLSAIFIECSWPSGRADESLYGHLSPEHLLDELSALATEIVKYRSNLLLQPRSRPLRKRQRKNPITADDLRGALQGLRVFVIHCKDRTTAPCDRPIRYLITEQVRSLVEEKGLGAEIICVDPGMRIEI